jgi:hypothetical protein
MSLVSSLYQQVRLPENRNIPQHCSARVAVCLRYIAVCCGFQADRYQQASISSVDSSLLIDVELFNYDSDINVTKSLQVIADQQIWIDCVNLCVRVYKKESNKL